MQLGEEGFMQTMSVVQVDKNRSAGCAVRGEVWIHGTGMRRDCQQSSPSTALCPELFCPYGRAAWGISGGKGWGLGGFVDFLIALSVCNVFLGLNTFLQQFC